PLGLLRAGVSVVRLLVRYDKPNNSGTVYCTGLGVIVASWSAQNATDQNNWVLTDSSLVNGKQAVCADKHPQAALTSIEVYSSTYYNQQQAFTFESALGSVTCQETNCQSGSALFALGRTAQNQSFPFIDLAQQHSTSNQDMAIALTTSASVISKSSSAQPPLPTPSTASSNSLGASTFRAQASQFRTPNEFSPTDTLEAGTPVINSNGQLTDVHLKAPSANNDIQAFINTTIPGLTSHPSSKVHDAWQQSMDAYSQGDLKTALTQFQIAATANPSFQGANIFAAPSKPSGRNTGEGQSNPTTNTISIAGVPIALWQLVIVIVALLAVLLLMITLLRARHQRALKADLEEANRRATIDAPQIAEMERAKAQQMVDMEAVQRAQAQQGVYEQPTQQSPVLVPAQPAAAMLPCPRCGELVPREAKYCSKCRLLLSPSESGMHLRPQAVSRPAVSNRSVTDQPTLLPPSAPPAPAMPAASIADQPTLEITPNRVSEQPDEPAKTEPYIRHQLSASRFKLMVGTRSDAGIKRKYKPNEDSLFAAQGLIDEAPTTHPYGLFVIADGMGGHANGQDASRLAIQTIIEYILPKLSKNAPLSNEEYAQLLVEGIQSANQAVHQRNIEQRGDMGTTVTGALVVDNVAYVVNVGDSRTYLYRDSDGLKKITNDHSVVASLVEAGIIKPDDIYTHPKRSHIYRSLGEKPNVEVDHFTVELQEGDKLLLCSDGLWDMVRDPKIENVIKSPDSNPVITSDALIQAAFEGGGEDNVSVIVIQIAEPTKATDMPRIDVLAKPDTVQMPQI
ncbi:MAG TPA: protein phosphatase 2C domain-containing protein, partial [Ktedonobacteraceae bacterium]|nr:protein phosphatase 2C domain-containing protein [Ktedonobacteraceae bacterium]